MRDGTPAVGIDGTVAGAGSSLITMVAGSIAAGAGGRGWAGGAAADLLVLRVLVFLSFSEERAMGAIETKRWKEEVTGDRW